VYRSTIDLTIKVITDRACVFRNQVVTVVIVSLIAIASAFYTAWALVGLLVLVPLSGFFLYLDTKHVADWRLNILTVWAQCDIDLLAFSQVMRAVPNIPEVTLNSMLNLLGKVQIWQVEPQASTQTRRTVTAVVRFADTLNLHQLVAKVFATAIVTVSICWSLAGQVWQPLELLVAILALPLVLRWLRTSLQHQSRAAIVAAKQHPDFDADIFRSLMEQVPLGGELLLADIWVESESAEL
jgi:hypothetical protein